MKQVFFFFYILYTGMPSSFRLMWRASLANSCEVTSSLIWCFCAPNEVKSKWLASSLLALCLVPTSLCLLQLRMKVRERQERTKTVKLWAWQLNNGIKLSLKLCKTEVSCRFRRWVPVGSLLRVHCHIFPTQSIQWTQAVLLYKLIFSLHTSCWLFFLLWYFHLFTFLSIDQKH